MHLIKWIDNGRRLAIALRILLSMRAGWEDGVNWKVLNTLNLAHQLHLSFQDDAHARSHRRGGELC